MTNRIYSFKKKKKIDMSNYGDRRFPPDDGTMFYLNPVSNI